MRSMAIFSLPAQLFAIIIALQGGGYLGLWFAYEVTKIICYVFAGYMVLNTIMNFISKSKKDWIFHGQNYKDKLLYQLIRTK